jgi:hypothetical protein
VDAGLVEGTAVPLTRVVAENSNIQSWVPSGLVTKASRDMTIFRTTFLLLI